MWMTLFERYKNERIQEYRRFNVTTNLLSNAARRENRVICKKLRVRKALEVARLLYVFLPICSLALYVQN